MRAHNEIRLLREALTRTAAENEQTTAMSERSKEAMAVSRRLPSPEGCCCVSDFWGMSAARNTGWETLIMT